MEANTNKHSKQTNKTVQRPAFFIQKMSNSVNSEGLIPSYLLKTAFGELLQHKMNHTTPVNSEMSRLSKLSALGIMGNVPSRYLNADYDSELANIFESNRSGTRAASSHISNVIEEEGNPELLNSIHYAHDTMDIDIDDDEDDEVGDGNGDNDNDIDDDEDIDNDEDLDLDLDDYGRRTSSSRSRSRKNSRSALSILNGDSTSNSNGFKYPLPTKWENSTNSSMTVSNGGLHLKVEIQSSNSSSHSLISKNYEYLVTKTDNKVPVNVGVFYFEIKILSVTNNNVKGNSDITVGFMNASLGNVTKMPGLEIGSYGFNGNDGSIMCNQSVTKKYNRKFGLGDTVGCGINFSTKNIFFTKNGVYLGVAFKDVNDALIPIIGLKNGNSISANFGHKEFLFDIDGYVNNEKVNIEKRIFSHVRVEDGESLGMRINPNTDKEIPNILQKLVSSYFDHLGYVDISKTFNEEVNDETRNDDFILKTPEEITADEDNLKIRQQIRKYILNGDIDSAIKLTNLKFPEVFIKNEELLFKLNCSKFIQYIKNSFIDKAIEIGQQLRNTYDSNQEFQEYLNDISSLIAFENPSQSEFGYLLKDEELYRISDDLNSEILKSLGKSSISRLESLVKHNKAMINYLNSKRQLDSLLINNEDLGL